MAFGDKLAAHLKQLAAKMSGSVEVGFLEGATYPDGTPVAAVASWNEYGHGGPFPAPPRPFFRPMIAHESPTWGRKLAAAYKHTEGDGNKALALMGEDIQGGLIQSIIDVTDPPLSKTTVLLRFMYGNNPQEIRARDVLAAQELIFQGHEVGVIANGAKAIANSATISETGAKPLVWTGHLIASTGYRVVVK